MCPELGDSGVLT